VVARRHSSAFLDPQSLSVHSVVADGEGRQGRTIRRCVFDGSARGRLLTRWPLGGIRLVSIERRRRAVAESRDLRRTVPVQWRETSGTKKAAGLPPAVVSGRQEHCLCSWYRQVARVSAGQRWTSVRLRYDRRTDARTDTGGAVGRFPWLRSAAGWAYRQSFVELRSGLTRRIRVRDSRRPQLVRRIETPGAAGVRRNQTSASVSGRGLLPSTSVNP